MILPGALLHADDPPLHPHLSVVLLLLVSLAGEEDGGNPLRLVLEKIRFLDVHRAGPHQLSLAVDRIESAVKRSEALRRALAAA